MFDNDSAENTATTGTKKTELKTTAATLAAFLGSFILLTLISNLDSDLLFKPLPDWAEVPILSGAHGLITWLWAYNTKHKPDAVSVSAVDAVRDWARRRGTTL